MVNCRQDNKSRRQRIEKGVKTGTRIDKNNMDLRESKFCQLPLEHIHGFSFRYKWWCWVPCGDRLEEECCLMVRLRSEDLLKLESGLPWFVMLLAGSKVVPVLSLAHWQSYTSKLVSAFLSGVSGVPRPVWVALQLCWLCTHITGGGLDTTPSRLFVRVPYCGSVIQLWLYEWLVC